MYAAFRLMWMNKIFVRPCCNNELNPHVCATGQVWLTPISSWCAVMILFDTILDRMWQIKTGCVLNRTSMQSVMENTTITTCHVQKHYITPDLFAFADAFCRWRPMWNSRPAATRLRRGLSCSTILLTRELLPTMTSIVCFGHLAGSWQTARSLGVHATFFLQTFQRRSRSCGFDFWLLRAGRLLSIGASWKTTDGDPQARAEVHLQLQFDLKLRITLRLKDRQLAHGVDRLRYRHDLKLFQSSRARQRQSRFWSHCVSGRDCRSQLRSCQGTSSMRLGGPICSRCCMNLSWFWLAHRMRVSRHFRATLQRPWPLPKPGQQASSSGWVSLTHHPTWSIGITAVIQSIRTIELSSGRNSRNRFRWCRDKMIFNTALPCLKATGCQTSTTSRTTSPAKFIWVHRRRCCLPAKHNQIPLPSTRNGLLPWCRTVHHTSTTRWLPCCLQIPHQFFWCANSSRSSCWTTRRCLPHTFGRPVQMRCRCCNGKQDCIHEFVVASSTGQS